VAPFVAMDIPKASQRVPAVGPSVHAVGTFVRNPVDDDP
jgi:hypothetical protein